MAVNGYAAAQDVADLKVATAALATAMGARVNENEALTETLQATVAAVPGQLETLENSIAPTAIAAAEEVVDAKVDKAANGSDFADFPTVRSNLGVPSLAALVASNGSGGDLLASKAAAGPSYLRTYRERVGDEISLWDIDGISQNKDAIIAGSYTLSLSTAINAALANYKRVIVRNGLYRFATPILLGMSEQLLEFEDGAWFEAMSSGTNGIACPHGILDAKVINPGLIGRATTEAQHTAILWNSNAEGTAAHGSLTSDDMGGLVAFARFKGLVPGTSAWNNFLHSNMAGGFRALYCVGKGLYGTASGNGYGHVASGSDVSSEGCDFDSLIAGQGRHAFYFGDLNVRGSLKGLRAKNFRKSAIAMNVGSGGGLNSQIEVSDCILTDVALDADSSATNGAIDFSYQGTATAGGSNITITNVQVKGVGSMGCYIRGYNKLTITDLVIDGWGSAPGGSYSGLSVTQCNDVTVANFQSYSSAANNGGSIIQHVKVQESARVQIKGGRAVNTGSGAQGTAVTLDATGSGTPDCLIDRFQADKGSGSWSIGPFSNPTQNGSAIVYYKQGANKVDTQTGANIVLDVSDGQSSVTLDAGATSILNITAAGPAQEVTLHFTGNTTLLDNNMYIAAPFAGTLHDTFTLFRTPAGLWVGKGSMVN